MSVEVLPVVLWAGSFVLSVTISVYGLRHTGRFIALSRRALRQERDIPVVGRSVILCHILSVIMAFSAYLLGSMVTAGDGGNAEASSMWSNFYRNAGVPSAVLIILALVVQWTCLYLRARAAYWSEMNARLDHVAKPSSPTGGFSKQ